MLWGISKTCLRQNSAATFWNFSKTFSNFVSAWIQLNANKKSCQDVFGLPHSPNSFAWYRRCCKAFPKCVSGKIEAHLIEIFLRHFQIVTEPNFSCILLKLNSEVSDLSPRPTSFAWYQKCCKAFPKCVLGEIQWHPIETIPRHFQFLSQPKFSWSLLNVF